MIGRQPGAGKEIPNGRLPSRSGLLTPARSRARQAPPQEIFEDEPRSGLDDQPARSPEPG